MPPALRAVRPHLVFKRRNSQIPIDASSSFDPIASEKGSKSAATPGELSRGQNLRSKY